MDWYNSHIEEPIRELVYRLRNDGINTECSCGHRMYVQCQFLDDCETFNIIYNIMCDLKINNYQIIYVETVRDGYKFQGFDIQLPDKRGLYQSEIKWVDNYIENKI